MGSICGIGIAGCTDTDVVSGFLASDKGPPFEFEETTVDRGIDYETTGAGIANTSAGVYVNDFDNDGIEDLLLVGGDHPVLYERTDNGFEESDALPDVSDALEGDDRMHSALFLDFDNDGWEELLLFPGGGTILANYSAPVGAEQQETDARPLVLQNQQGEFVVDHRPDVELARWPIGAAAADYDGDGHLDVFVYQNGDWAMGTPTGYRDPETIAAIEQREDLVDNGAPNLLLAGDGTTFTDVISAAGIEGERWSLAASFVDLTNDGYPDIHVANDFNEDTLYLNRGDGTFEQRFMGEANDRNQMSSEVQDLTGNGYLDIYVTNIEVDRDQLDAAAKRGRVFNKQQAAIEPRYFGGNNLWINQGDGEFVDRADEFNVKQRH